MFGSNRQMETPDYIPNSAVKPLYAYDTRNGKVG